MHLECRFSPGSKLITALGTAVENGEGMLDKEATSHDDLFDAFRMSSSSGNGYPLEKINMI